MATDIVIPEAGESITSGVIAGWLKEDGQWVDRDEPILEVETDKITVEVVSPVAGVLKTSASVDDEVDIGAVVGSIDESAENPASSSEPKPAESSSPPPAPSLPASSPAPSPAPTAASASSANDWDQVRQANKGVPATPVAHKIADEHHVNLSQVIPTGAGHRVREQDVLAFVQTHKSSPAPSPELQPGTTKSDRNITVKKLSPLRQKLASRLVEAQQTAAMLTTFNECDMSAVMALRTQYKEDFKEKFGVGLGFMSFFVSAVAAALQAVPKVNSYITTDGSGQPAMQSHDYCDIAIAIAGAKGLVVPVLRDCQSLSFDQIERQIKAFALRAQEGKLTLEEMQGGTFTITNGGIFGSLMSTPILNPPQSAILGMHSIKNRAVEDPANPGQVVIRPMMYLALSYDHRIIDGSEAVTFLVKIKEMIEDPSRLLFGI